MANRYIVKIIKNILKVIYKLSSSPYNLTYPSIITKFIRHKLINLNHFLNIIHHLPIKS